MKRIISLALVAVMAFSSLMLASCDEEGSSVASETASSVASEATSEAASEESSEEASEVASEEESEEESEEVSEEIPEEVKETASYKAVASIDYANGVTIKTDIDFMGISMTICSKGEDLYVYMEMAIEEATQIYTIIIKEGKTYTFDEVLKTYAVIEGVESPVDLEEYKAETMFAGLSFVSTTTEEIDGVTYTVEIFATADDMETKYYLDAEGNIKMTSAMGITIPLEISASVIEGCFELPSLDDYEEEVIEDEVVEGDEVIEE